MHPSSLACCSHTSTPHPFDPSASMCQLPSPQKIFGWRPDVDAKGKSTGKTYTAVLTVDRAAGTATSQSWVVPDSSIFTGPVALNQNGQVGGCSFHCVSATSY